MPQPCNPPEESRDVVARWAADMSFTPGLDDRAAVLKLFGNSTRLRMLFVLDRLQRADPNWTDHDHIVEAALPITRMSAATVSRCWPSRAPTAIPAWNCIS